MYPVVEFYLSGELSQKEFCQQNDLTLSVFNYWLKRYRKDKINNSENTFASIEIDHCSSSVIELTLPNGVHLKIPLA